MQRLPRMRKERRRIKEKCDCTRPEDVVDWKKNKGVVGGIRDAIRPTTEEKAFLLLNSNLKVGGIVITQFDRRKTLNRSVREIVNDSFHEKVFKTVIRDNVALAEAPINGKTIFEYNPKSNGASDYMSLAKEVLNLK